MDFNSSLVLNATLIAPAPRWFSIAASALRLILSTLGVFGNAQVVAIYSGKASKSPSEYIILNLGTADLLYGLGAAASELYTLFATSPSSTVQLLVKGFQRFSFIAIQSYSFICVFIITLNRYFAVCRPHRYKEIFTFTRTIFILGSSALLSLVLGGVQLFAEVGPNLSLSTSSQIRNIIGGIILCMTAVDMMLMLVVYVLILRASYERICCFPGDFLNRAVSFRGHRANQDTNVVVRLEHVLEKTANEAREECQQNDRLAPVQPDVEHSFITNSPVQERKVQAELQPLAERSNGARQTKATNVRSGSARRTTSVTISLFIISFLFMVFTLPYKIQHFMFFLDPSTIANEYIFHFGLCLFTANFGVNYFVYLYFNTFFRTQLKNFWKFKCRSYQ